LAPAFIHAHSYTALVGARPLTLCDLPHVQTFLSKSLLQFERIADLVDDLRVRRLALSPPDFSQTRDYSVPMRDFSGSLSDATAFDAAESALLQFDGANVEDLCLDFTVPGHPDRVLPASRSSPSPVSSSAFAGSSSPFSSSSSLTAASTTAASTAAAAAADVTLANVRAYVDAVGAFFLVDACAAPVAALRRGFGAVLDLAALRCLRYGW
jgi:hypothetical protein